MSIHSGMFLWALNKHLDILWDEMRSKILVRMNLTAVSYNKYFLSPQGRQMQQTCSQDL